MPQEPFFIGWESKAPVSLREFVRRATILFIAFGATVAAITSMTQRTTGSGTFDFGNVQSFTGLLLRHPVPLLISDAPIGDKRTFYLVNPLKHGFSPDVAAALHLQKVTLEGTLIQDNLDAMIEVVPDSVRSLGDDGDPATALPPSSSSLGATTLRGEIVDSKCHLGVMNPGRFKPHRACAIRCIAGGIPPILVTQDSDGHLAHYLLVGPDGEAINDQILDYIAEPVTIEGTLRRSGDLNVFHIDPASITRLAQ